MASPARLAACAFLASLLPSVAAEDYAAWQSLTYTNRPPARALASAVLQHTLADTSALGRYVWLFGGLDTSLGALNDLWRLDMQSGAWSSYAPHGPEPMARRGATLALSESRAAYLFGGETAGRVRLNDLFILHLGASAGATPFWENIVANVSGTMPSARSEHSATTASLLARTGEPNGLVVFGGVGATGVALDDLHALDYATLTWEALAPSGVRPQARKGHAACLVLNSILAVFGGSNPDVPVFFGDLHLYDIARNTWLQPAPTSSSLRPGGRDGHTMALLGETVYVFGGVNAQGEKLSDLWSFNVYAAVSGHLRWAQPVTMSVAPTPRWGHVSLPSLGVMTVLGGTGSTAASPQEARACESRSLGADSAPLSSRRGPQVALKFDCRSDRVTRD